MNYYTVKEVATILNFSERKTYHLIKKIGELTAHKFLRTFRGHFYRDKPRKEIMIAEIELEAFSKIESLRLEERITQKKAILQVFDGSW